MVRARARNEGGQWSALNEAVFVLNIVPPIRISEVMYHPADPPEGSPYTDDDFEFVEIVNTGGQDVDVSGVVFANGVQFTCPATVLRTGEYAVVISNPEAFATRYETNGLRVLGQYTGGFANQGERVELLASAWGPEIAGFTLNDGRGWPLTADGTGHSLIPLRLEDQPLGVLDYGGNWRASAYIGGSPGEADTEPARPVRINEIAAHTDYSDPLHPEHDSNDWIEFYNSSASEIIVRRANWYLSDSSTDLRKWQIPVGTVIPAQGWVTFYEVTDFHVIANGVTNGFGLDKGGEGLFLSHLPEQGFARVVDCVRFKGQLNGGDGGALS